MKHSYKNQIVRLLTTSAILLGVTACAYDTNDHSYSNIDGSISNNNVEDALADQPDLSLFYQALQSTGVANELNEVDEGYTIFVPTNAAFSAIKPRAYPCFYAVQCSAQIAAVLRNHIVPKNESVARFSRWGGSIPTIGSRRLDIEEPYKGRYTVEGRNLLYHTSYSEFGRTTGSKINFYRIDGVIISPQELAAFRMQPTLGSADTVMEKTTTTYRMPAPSPQANHALSGSYFVPGGYPAPPADANAFLPVDEQTTTTTRTTTTN